MQGGPSGNGNAASIGNNSGSGGQSLTVGSGGIQIIGGAGGGASIDQNSSVDTQTIVVTDGNISLIGGESGTNNRAQIYSNGAQNVSASGLTLTGGSGGTYNSVGIGSSGDQQISTNMPAGITIQGGAGTSYGNNAAISHGGSGNQTININGGGSVTLTAGSGTGATDTPSLVPAVCASDPNCFSIPVADDVAGIYSGVGNQSLTFQTPGGVLSLTGGSGGNENKVYIANGGTGTQSITGFPTITLTGGASGGSNYLSTDGIRYLLNNASLFSPNGAADDTGEFIDPEWHVRRGRSLQRKRMLRSTVTGQNITVTNAITLNSGTSAVAYTLHLEPGESVHHRWLHCLECGRRRHEQQRANLR